jgi:hypothetical protein
MTAIEDPAAQLSSAAAGAEQSSDELEHWLSDLRTEAAAGASGWINNDAAGEDPAGQAVERSPLAPDQSRTGVSEPSSGGRHRAAD